MVGKERAGGTRKKIYTRLLLSKSFNYYLIRFAINQRVTDGTADLHPEGRFWPQLGDDLIKSGEMNPFCSLFPFFSLPENSL